MTIIRFNTILINLRNLPRIPAYLEIHDWLINNFGITVGTLRVIDISGLRKRLTLKFKEADAYYTFIKKLRHVEIEYEQDGQPFYLPYITLNGRNKEVYVKELPEEADLEKLMGYIQEYGLIKEYRWEQSLNDALPQDLGAHKQILKISMELNKDIPQNVNFEGERLMINYIGQPVQCFLCKKEGHMGRECPEKIQKDEIYNKEFPTIGEKAEKWVHPKKISKPVKIIDPIQSSSDSSNDEDSETDSSDSSPSRNSNQPIPQNRNEKKKTKKVKVVDKETKDRIGKRNRNSQSPENDQPKKIVIIEELDQNEICVNSPHPSEATKTQEHATRVTMPHFVLDEHVLIMPSRPINCQLVHSSPNTSLQTENLKHALTDKNNQQTGFQNEKYT